MCNFRIPSLSGFCRGFERLVIIDGLVSEDLGLKEDGGVGRLFLQHGRDSLDKAGIQRIQQGIVTGVSGFLSPKVNVRISM